MKGQPEKETARPGEPERASFGKHAHHGASEGTAQARSSLHTAAEWLLLLAELLHLAAATLRHAAAFLTGVGKELSSKDASKLRGNAPDQ